MRQLLIDRVNAYARRAASPHGVVVYFSVDKGGVRCVAAAPKQYAAIAKLEEVGAAQIAGVYRCEKQADAHQIAELMLTDIQEIAACE